MGSSLYRLLVLTVVSFYDVILLWGPHGVDGRYLPSRAKFPFKQDVCVEPSCVLASSSILQALDTSVDPCQDFYQYSCGGWLENNDITAGKSSHSRFGELAAKNSRIIRKLLERNSDVFNGKESDAVRKAKNFYNACMNVTVTEEAGGQPVKEVIKLLGGWSLLDDLDVATSEPKSDHSIPYSHLKRLANMAVHSDQLLDTLVASNKLAVDPLFAMSVTVDDKNSSAHIIEFYQSGLLLLAPELYDDQSLVDSYIELGAMVALLLKFGERFDPDGEQEVEYYLNAVDRMKTILAFESELAQAFVPTDDLQDPDDIYHKMTVEQLAASIPALDISLYLNQMFDTAVPGDEDILVYTPEYFVRLSAILQKTPEEVIKDYIVWQTVFPMLPYLSSAFRQALGDFENSFRGSNSGFTPLWEVCLGRTQDALGEVTGALFVQEHIPYDTKEQVEDVLKTVRQAFMDNLPTLTWMEESTKATAYQKAQAMEDKIGWPDWLLDAEKLDKRLSKVMVDPSDQFLNMIWIRRYYVETTLQLRGQPVDKSEFEIGADVVNAYYNPYANEMIFPAGILQSPFYSPFSPMAVNYGGIGLVMGHELTHGFDDAGRKYDKFGNLNDWWDDKSEAQYEKRTECMVKQYDNYTVAEGVQVDGLLTLGENIADNGGIRTSFRAFKSWLNTKQGQMEKQFAGLQDFTSEQLFFIGMAQVWCRKETPESAVFNALTNEHSPAPFRVKGMVTNMPEFADVFQCPQGTPMNPDKKCRVW